jgi:hypothetical protein
MANTYSRNADYNRWVPFAFIDDMGNAFRLDSQFLKHTEVNAAGNATVMLERMVRVGRAEYGRRRR